MTYEQFAEFIKEQITEAFGETVEISEHTSRKVNASYRSICVCRKGAGTGIDIPAELYYQKAFNGHNQPEIAQEIVNLLEERLPETDINLNYFLDWNNVKDKVIVAVINRELNREFLMNFPHREVLDDLALICRIAVNESIVETGVMSKGTETGFMNVSRPLMEHWGITEDVLFEYAMKNSQDYYGPVNILSMSEMFMACNFRGIPVEDIEEAKKHMEMVQSCPETRMYLLASGKSGGASCIFLPCGKEALVRLSEEFDRDLIILPSSTDEVLVMGNYEQVPYEGLIDMIRDGNRTITESNNGTILSTHPYIYHRDTREITPMKTMEELFPASIYMSATGVPGEIIPVKPE